MIYYQAFDSAIPSVFVIGSPFQALCLVGAVRNLRLTDYRVVVIHSDRFMQVKTVLDKFGIEFETRHVGWHRWKMRWYRITSMMHRNNKYKRLFVGDFRNETLLYFGLQYVADGSDIVYLDDGNASIPLFDGSRTSLPLGKDTSHAMRVAERRGISFMKYFYSIYDGFSNSKYVIRKNELSILLSSNSGSTKSKVYFIGTNNSRYCACYNVPEESLMKVLEDVFKSIKERYPSSPLVYIPHGKDTSKKVYSICENNSVEYKNLNVPVELFFVNEEKPLAIYGFGSSALYNLKQMFPESEVLNVLLPSSASEDKLSIIKSISDYYESHGIKQVKIEL